MRSATISLALWKKIANLILAQFRTCLWPCVDRRVSGQEAGQPPKEGIYLPCTSDRQLEAKPAIPALNGGRGLKQRRKGFLGTAGANAGDTEEACPSLPTVRNGISLIRDRKSTRLNSS